MDSKFKIFLKLENFLGKDQSFIGREKCNLVLGARFPGIL